MQLSFETFLILRRNQRDIVIDVKSIHVKHPLLLSDFNDTSIFSTDFSKKSQISNFIKIRPVGAELFHADRRTSGHNEADSRFP